MYLYMYNIHITVQVGGLASYRQESIEGRTEYNYEFYMYLYIFYLSSGILSSEIGYV